MSAFRHSVRLAYIDISRMLRTHTDVRGSSSAVVGALVYVLLLVGTTVGGGYLGRRIGDELAAGGPLFGIGAFEVAIARGIIALFWLIITLVYVVRAVGERGTLASPEGVLTVVPTGQALVGIFIAEYIYFLMWLLVPAIGFGVGLAIGTGTVWPVVAVPAGVSAAGLASVSLGYPLGLSIRHVASRFEFVARHKGAIIAVIFVSYFLALSTGAWNELMVQLFEPMQRTPVGWYADLLFLGTPGITPSTTYAAGAIALSSALAVLGAAAGTQVADRHWFSDPVLAGTEQERPDKDTVPGIERRLEPVLGRSSAALLMLSWRRARRSPLKLLYAFYPLLILAGLFANIIQTGEVPAYLPYAILVFLAWAAGVIFTLNPLGDQGAVLASTLLSRVDGRTFVRAHLLAGLIVAVPLGTLVTAVVAVLSPIDQETVLALVVTTPVVMIVAAGFSVGVGMAFPRFEATTVTKSMKTVLPSKWAFILFSCYLFGTATAAAVVYERLVRELTAGFISWILPFGVSVSPEGLYLTAIAVLVPLALLPVVSYRYAIKRFDSYSVA